MSASVQMLLARSGSATRSQALLVDTPEALAGMLEAVQAAKRIAADIEGIDLDRNGKICLLAIAISPTSVWVVDVVALGDTAFKPVASGQASLKDILESPEIEKLIFDPRMDSDALFHQFGVHLKNVFDVQLAEVAHRRARGLSAPHCFGLGKCLDTYVPLQVKLSPFRVDKAAVHMRLDREREYRVPQAERLFARRPLGPELLLYCAQDVVHLFELYNRLTRNLSAVDLNKVRQASQKRVDECFTLGAPVQGRHRALAPPL